MKKNIRTFRRRRVGKQRVCEFCTLMIDYLSFRNVTVINKLINYQGRIIPAKFLGTCARHQRMVALAIKRARYMAIIPFSKPRIRQKRQLVPGGDKAKTQSPFSEPSKDNPTTTSA